MRVFRSLLLAFLALPLLGCPPKPSAALCSRYPAAVARAELVVP